MLLGAVNGRTITGDQPGSPESKLERSNAFTDHTFIKAQTDQSYPAATYTVTGNTICPASGLAPVGAVSRKTHTNVATSILIYLSLALLELNLATDRAATQMATKS